MAEHRDEVRRLITELRVPLENNQAERENSMPKLKQKVSGGFRGEDRAQAFAITRSYLSTLRKHSLDAYDALVMTFQGNPPMPRLT